MEKNYKDDLSDFELYSHATQIVNQLNGMNIFNAKQVLNCAHALMKQGHVIDIDSVHYQSMLNKLNISASQLLALAPPATVEKSSHLGDDQSFLSLIHKLS